MKKKHGIEKNRTRKQQIIKR